MPSRRSPWSRPGPVTLPWSLDLAPATQAIAAFGLAGHDAIAPAHLAAAWHDDRDAIAQHHLDGCLVAATAASPARHPDDARSAAVLEDRLTSSRVWHEVQTIETVGALEAHGIEVRALKGTALSRLDYPDPQLRPTSDLDLLVRGDDIDEASALLVGLGGRRIDPDPVDGFVRTVGKGATVAMPSGLEVDLHRLLIWGPLGVRTPTADLWRASRSFTVGPSVIETLPLEESLLHAALHLLVLGWRRALTARDVLQLLSSPELDPDRLFHLARRWGAESVLATAALLSSRELDVPLDGPIRTWASTFRPPVRDRLWLRIERSEDPIGIFEAPATYLELRTRAERRVLLDATFRPLPGTYPPPTARVRRGLTNFWSGVQRRSAASKSAT